MSSRKRPPGPRSRDTSPPEKRSRLSERSILMQERDVNIRSPTIPGPPASRRTSLSSLPASVPTGPAPKTRLGLRTDQYRPGSNKDPTDKTLQNGVSRPVGDATARNDLQPTSTGSTGGSGTTPVQAAPPVPRMLPISGGSAPTNRILQQEQATSPEVPISIESLRNLRKRKQAIARHANSVGMKVDNLSATTPTAAQLDIRFKTMQTELAQLKTANSSMQAELQTYRLERSETLEKPSLTAELKGLREEVKDIKPLLVRVAKLEAAESSRAEKDQADVDHIKQVKGTQESQEKAISAIKNDIESVQTWKKMQSEVVTSEIGEAKEGFQEKIRSTETRLTERIDEDLKNLKGLSADVKKSLNSQKSLETKIEGLNAMERSKDSEAMKQVKTFQSRLSKLSDEQKSASTSQDALSERVHNLETTNAATKADNSFVDSTKIRLDQLDIDVKELQKMKETINGLTSTITDVKERLGVAKQSTEQYEQLTKDIEGLRSQISEMKPILATIQEPGAEDDSDETPLGKIRCDIRTMDNYLTEVETTLHMQSNLNKVLQKQVPALFKDHFDSFKETVDQQLETINSELEKARGTIAGTELQTQPSTVVEDLSRLNEETAQLRVSLTEEVSARDRDVVDIKRQLGSKADTVATKNRIDTIIAGINGLQEQYNNITTDDVYQRMVHWFVQMYPDASHLLQELHTVQQSVGQLQNFRTNVSWVLTREPEIIALLNDAPQLQNLLLSATDIQQAADTAHSTITEVGESCKSSIDELNDKVNQLRGEFNTVNDNYIEPNNVWFNMIGTTVILVANLKAAIELINQELPKPLELNLPRGFEALVATATQHHAKGSNGSNGKGKHKRRT